MYCHGWCGQKAFVVVMFSGELHIELQNALFCLSELVFIAHLLMIFVGTMASELPYAFNMWLKRTWVCSM